MDVLLKVALTPSLILLVTLLQRRWRHVLGGWLAALPLTSGPFVLILAYTQGAAAAAAAVRGILLGMPAVLVFYMVYTKLASRWRWPSCLAATVLASMATGTALVLTNPPLPVVFSLLVLGFLLSLRSARGTRTRMTPASPRWELLARVGISAILVLLLGIAAKLLTAQLAGVLATFPALAAVLIACTHRADGWVGPVQLVRGLLGGMPLTALLFTGLLAALAN